MESEAGEPAKGINFTCTIRPNLKMEMSAGGETSRAHTRNFLPSFNFLSLRNEEIIHVAVHRDSAVVVTDTDPVAIASSWTRVDNDTVCLLYTSPSPRD